jgi:hypothetical protein
MPREAVPAFEKALAIRPNQPTIKFKLVEAYKDLGDDKNGPSRGRVNTKSNFTN